MSRIDQPSHLLNRPLIMAIGAGILIAGCGSAFITRANKDKFSYTVASTSTSYKLTAPQLYDWLEKSSYLPDGGLLDRDQVRKFVDTILCDTLAGLRASALRLDDHPDHYWMYRQRYEPLLVTKFFKVMTEGRLASDSEAVIQFYNSRSDL